MRKARVTVVQQVYHQPPDEPGRQFDSRFTRDLETDEEPVQKRVTVAPVDGWVRVPVALTSASQVILSNLGGGSRETHPTDDEVAAERLLILQIGVKTGWSDHPVPVMMVPPGESLRFQPVPYPEAELVMSSPAGKTRVQVVSLPG